jgi:hypothetical protein
MNNLVGRIFSLADGRYRIVDVQRLSGDALVYAEREELACGASPVPSGGAKPPGRMAFHYGDIARYLEAGTGL